MAVDIPFKTPLEVSEAISLLEARFTDRYTEQDPSYCRVVEGGQRSDLFVIYWLQIPLYSAICMCADCSICVVSSCNLYVTSWP